jgi:hypothetical protein
MILGQAQGKKMKKVLLQVIYSMEHMLTIFEKYGRRDFWSLVCRIVSQQSPIESSSGGEHSI